MNKFHGTGVALVTPFKSNKEVDHESLRKIVSFQIENGVNYLVVLGTTGESATLTKAEKEAVIKTVVAENNSRVPLVLGIGGNNTAAIAEEMKLTDLSAFDAILSVSPYYNKPTQEGIYQHYKMLSEASPKSIILYNVPGRTSSNMLPETVGRIARDCENIIGIKEAAGDMVQALKLIAAVPKDFLVISGDDMITLPMVLAGGHGVISVIAQGFPKQFSQLVELGLERKVEDAYEIQYKIAPAIDMIFAEGNPAGIKAVLQKRGLCENELRLPLVPVSGKLEERLGQFIEDFQK